MAGDNGIQLSLFGSAQSKTGERRVGTAGSLPADLFEVTESAVLVDPNRVASVVHESLPVDVVVAVPVAAPAVVRAMIQDAGAELVYNRRNRSNAALGWADIAGLNDALKMREVVKAKVWPRPDFEKLIEEGMPPPIAHILKQVYDSVAVKPKIGTRSTMDDTALQTYIAGLNRVEAGCIAWASDRAALQKWVDAHAEAIRPGGGYRDLSLRLGPSQGLLSAVYPLGWREYRTEFMMAGGNKLLGALQPGLDELKQAFKAINGGWPKSRESWEIQGYKVADNVEVTVNAGRDGKRIVIAGEMLIKGCDSEEEALLVKASIKPYLLSKKNRLLGSYDSHDEAVEAARLLSRRAKTETIGDVGKRVEDVERIGPSRRMEGEDVSSERLLAEFGLKGVNFGNWMKTSATRAEAQLHLNHAFDSLHDLADILGVPPKAMSLNGMLGLAIGAQGNGGRNAAHFVPGVNEINLTRTSGAGSLAHEWAHALDHYFATQGGLASVPEPFLTEHASHGASKVIMRQLAGGGHEPTDVARYPGLRPEITGAFSAIVDAMDKRAETVEEALAARGAKMASSRKSLTGWLSSVRRDFDGLEVEFDGLSARVLNGDVGDGKVALSRAVYVSPVLDNMRDLYKSKHGHVYAIEKLKAVESWITHIEHQKQQAIPTENDSPKLVKSNYSKSAVKLDETKGGKPYWSTNLEKFARAFDGFVSDALEAKQAMNGYLSHTGEVGETVPAGAERVAINTAFQGLVGELKVRETEKGTALFSAQALSLGTTMPLSEIEAEIVRLQAQWPSMPRVTVVSTTRDLPFDAPWNADGAYCNGQVYVVASNVADLKQLQKVMAHECVMHHSLEEMLGDYGFSKLHHGIQKLKVEGDPAVVGLAANILSRYGVLAPEIETKEIVARAGELCLDDTGNVRVAYGFMKGVYAGVAGWLRDHGIPVPFTNSELQGIMHNAGEWGKQERSDRVVHPVVFVGTAAVQREGAAVLSLGDGAGVGVRSSKAHVAPVGLHIGIILDIAGDVVTQKVGREGKTSVHSLSNLRGAVVVGAVVEISYKDGRGEVGGKAPGQALGR